MTIEFRLKDQINARAPRSSLAMSWSEGVPMRLSDLIRERAILEWEHRNDSTDSDVYDAMLPDEAQPLAMAGSWRQPKTRDEAVTFALEGFRRSAFFVLVDDRSVPSLESEIVLTAETTITFIRLLPMLG